MPNAIKRHVLNFGFRKIGQNQFIASITNLGIAKMPEAAMRYIDRFEVLLGETPIKHIAIALISDGKNMNISFTSNAARTNVQRDFFTFLSQKGVKVRIECNDKESWLRQ